MSHETTSIDQLPVLLREFERRIDDAFSAYGDLAGALPRARVEARLSAVVGQTVIDRLCEAGSAIGAARGHTVTAHRLLERIARSIGMEDDPQIGDERPKPKFFTTGEAEVIPFDADRTAA